jgi:hypothetical protein
MGDQAIAYCSVFPKIGIARLGNSDECFVGPESPGVPANPRDGFKDEKGFVKRQAARFRVYGFDAQGKVVKELTAKDTGEIKWRVSLANKKASWYEFAGAQKALDLFEGRSPKTPALLRNNDWAGDRRELVMKSNSAIEGTNQSSPPMWGAIYEHKEPVYLGELRTDDRGRLLVLGGHGCSKAISDDDSYLINQYANNDGWYDDTSDGPVAVEVTMPDGSAIPVRGGAWVVVTPPDFSPYTENLVTLFDVMEEVALVNNLPWHLAATRPPVGRSRVAFLDDVYPILRRLVEYQWVNKQSLRGHGPGKKANFLSDVLLAPLANEQDAHGSDLRGLIVSMIRNPNLSGGDAEKQANYWFMPQLAGDEGDPEMGNADTWLRITKRQYETLSLWASNSFDGFSTLKSFEDARKKSAPVPLEELPLGEQPFALTKGALSACVGGPFYPGIEMTSICRSKDLYAGAFELCDKLVAGDVTKWMALPWQADFYECNTHWWPAQRPDDVVSEYDYQDAREKFSVEERAGALATLLFPRKQWARGVDIGRTLRPSFDWPSPDPDETTTDFAKRAQTAFVGFANHNWTFRGRRWYLPKPKENESLGRYQFRLREYFDRYSGKLGLKGEQWYFPLPSADADDDLADYEDSVVSRFQSFIAGLTPTPENDETLDAFLVRLQTPVSAWNGFIASTSQIGYEVRLNYIGDNQMVRMWKELGFIVPAPDSEETILVETGRDKYAGLKDRDYFYIMLNFTEFPDFREKAIQLCHKFLNDAKALQKTKQFKSDPDQRVYEVFKYSPGTFEARLEQIYNQLAAEGQLFSADDEGWHKPDVVERIRQLAPFNQLDGAWLRYATDAGPIADINSFLFDIWSDETGNGDPALNHANLYTALLQSQGIYLPDLRSRDYVDNPDLLDSAFTASLFELVISQFSEDFFPEILGMTLQLEWEVLSLWPGVKRLERWNINSQFYRMHIGIDNADDGHGAKARMAVQQYLDHVREKSGPEEVEKQWERIWTGYAAFATTGDIGNDLIIQRDYPPTIEQQMVSLVTRKQPFAQLNHGNDNLPKFAGNRLNDWFEEPEGLLDQLANSNYIIPGDPDMSYLLNDRTTYRGPMYKVFTQAELKLWADWIRWLAKSYVSEDAVPSDPALLMKQLVERMTPLASGESAHESRQLTTTINGKQIKQSVAEWFIAGAIPLMMALRDPANNLIVLGNALASPFFTTLLPSAQIMASTIDAVTIGGKKGTDIIKAWVNASCPLPAGAALEFAPLRPYLATVSRLRRVSKGQPLYRKQLFGRGAVH